MSENAALVICITILAILFAGEPDLMTAINTRLMNTCVEVGK